jgi:hypothetical protein
VIRLFFRTSVEQIKMGLYQEGIAKDEVNGKDVTAHIFE